MKYANIILVSVAGIFFACQPTAKQPAPETNKLMEQTNWLIGEWRNFSPEGNATEVWAKENDSTLSGKSCFVIGGDTVSSESLSLVQRNNQLYYIPVVRDQNSGQPVEFALTSASDKQLVFENPQHDFPTKIMYTKITEDSLVAEISGMNKGQPASQQYPMARAK